MNFSRPLFKPWLIGGVLLLLIADLWSKAWAFEAVGLHMPAKNVLGEWLSVYCITNAGGIWGVGGGGGFTTVLTIVRLIAVGFLIVFINRQHKKNTIGIATLGLLLAGALGNLYDNLSSVMPWSGNGEVRDFIMFQVSAPSFIPENIWLFDPFPIFNVADACISIGFVLLLTGVAKLGDSFKAPQE
ncbi:MAG: signal peptidase II [Myxococcota bacterium]|jgi:signal peptidase II